MHPLLEVIQKRQGGQRIGVYSVCCANRLVIEAVLETAKETGVPPLIEATSNQVNQFGGYTGMNPTDFVHFIYEIAQKVGFPIQDIVLGGDHLGPLVWQDEPEESALQKAEELVRQYVLAGFSKIHIDTSMMLAGDDRNKELSDEVIARRAARLVEVTEAAYREFHAQNASVCAPVYVIGSEVPIPGGAQKNNERISVTTPDRFERTYETFKHEFHARGLQKAFERIIGVVVQPGVEFSDATVTPYDRKQAHELCASLKRHPGIIFEGHSTDYQTKTSLRQMVEDGIAILKVGPAFTYALRQALFALGDIERELLGATGVVLSEFRDVLDTSMQSNPIHWERHYFGSEHEISLKRKYSFSDRCRYYLPSKEVVAAIDILLGNLDRTDIPLSVLHQYLPLQYEHVREGRLAMTAAGLLKDRVKDFIGDYVFAVAGQTLR